MSPLLLSYSSTNVLLVWRVDPAGHAAFPRPPVGNVHNVQWSSRETYDVTTACKELSRDRVALQMFGCHPNVLQLLVITFRSWFYA
jgi:hypothetical protein